MIFSRSRSKSPLNKNEKQFNFQIKSKNSSSFSLNSNSSSLNSSSSFSSSSLSYNNNNNNEIPQINIKKKPEPLSPKSSPSFFDKRGRQVSPCSSRDTSPTPSQQTLSQWSLSQSSLSPKNNSTNLTNNKQIERRPLTSPAKFDRSISLNDSNESGKLQLQPNFVSSKSNLYISRRDSDKLEELCQKISEQDLEKNQNNNNNNNNNNSNDNTNNNTTSSSITSTTVNQTIQSKKIVEYCKQLSRTESNAKKLRPRLSLHLSDSEDDVDGQNPILNGKSPFPTHEHIPSDISPPRSTQPLPLSARQKSARLFSPKKLNTSSPQSKLNGSASNTSSPLSTSNISSNSPTSPTSTLNSQNSQNLQNSQKLDPNSPSLLALIDYSKSLIRLASKDSINEITTDRVAYANHALQFAQTTLNSPLTNSISSDPVASASFYSTMLKSQSLLAHTQQSKYSESDTSKEKNSIQFNSNTQLKKEQVPSLNITEVTEFQSRNQKSPFQRINSWSPSTTPSRFMSGDESDSQNNIFTQLNNSQSKERPVSSERYLKSSQSFSFTPKSSYFLNNNYNITDNYVEDETDDDSSEDNSSRNVYHRDEVNFTSHTTTVKRYPRKIHADILNGSPELIQQKLEEMGSEVKYSYQEDFLNE